MTRPATSIPEELPQEAASARALAAVLVQAADSARLEQMAAELPPSVCIIVFAAREAFPPACQRRLAERRVIADDPREATWEEGCMVFLPPGSATAEPGAWLSSLAVRWTKSLSLVVLSPEAGCRPRLVIIVRRQGGLALWCSDTEIPLDLIDAGIQQVPAGTAARLITRRAERGDGSGPVSHRSQDDVFAEHSRLSLAIEVSDTGTFEWDLSTNQVEWSSAHYRIFGYEPFCRTPDYQMWRDRVHPEDVAEVEAALSRAIAGRETYAIVYRVVRPDGEVRRVESRGRTFYGHDGAPVSMFGVVFDVTGRHAEEPRPGGASGDPGSESVSGARGSAERQQREAVADAEARARTPDPDQRGSLPPILESITDPVSAFDREYRLIALNNAMRAALLELTGKELNTGDSMLTILDHMPGQQEASLQLWNRALSGESFTARGGFDTAGGEMRHWEMRFDPLYDSKGRQIGAVHVARDISDLERRHLDTLSDKEELEELVSRRTAELETLLENAPAGFALFDENLRYIRVNKHLAEMNGIPAARHRGRRVRDVLTDNAGKIEAVLREVLETGCPAPDREFSGSTRGEPDQVRHWLAGFYPVILDGHRVTGVGAIIYDITERRETEQALRQADERKNRFLAMLGHELRNPLGAMLHGLEILGSEAVPRQEKLWVAPMLERQAYQLQRLVDDLQDVSRISTGKISLRLQDVRLEDAIREAIAAVRSDIETAHHHLSVHLPDNLSLTADHARLVQILVNLLSNAVKYTSPGGTIEIEGCREGGNALIVVRDSGRGIPPEDLEKVFEEFCQPAQTGEEETRGLGLGLTLVRSLTELHGGRVSAMSDGPGTGTAFEVTLPLRHTAYTDEATPSDASGLSLSEPHRDIRRVLVVDDYPDLARGFMRTLNLAGYEAACAMTGQEAVDLWEELQPDVILLDISLPDKSGWDVARELREAGCGARLIALSGYSGREQSGRARGLGFSAHLVKPVTRAQLMKTLKALEAVAE